MATASSPKDMLVGDTGLAAFLTDKELPSCLENWKGILKNESKNNVGLALRWEAGLAAMEALSTIPDDSKMQLSNEWASIVKKMVDEAEMIDTFCVERSIVSIRIAKNGGGWLDMDEARNLYRWMSLDISAAVPSATPDDFKTLAAVKELVKDMKKNKGDPAELKIAISELLRLKTLCGDNAPPPKQEKKKKVAVET